MRDWIAALLLSGCSLVDALDGHIDEQEHCCVALTADRIRECLVRLGDAPGWCWEAECAPPIGYVDACEVDGAVVACTPRIDRPPTCP